MRLTELRQFVFGEKIVRCESLSISKKRLFINLYLSTLSLHINDFKKLYTHKDSWIKDLKTVNTGSLVRLERYSRPFEVFLPKEMIPFEF